MEEVINVALAGHVDHGKSTLVEAITGKFPDRKEFELKRGMTAILKVINFEYKGVKVNLLDTPGHVDFRSAVNLALLAADGLILVVAADEGVKSRTEYIARKALQLKLPVVVAANKIDLPAADPERVKRQLMEIGLHAPVVPISAKMKWGIEELLSEAIAHIKAKRGKDKRIVVLGHERKTGIGQVFLLSIRGGTIREGEELGPVKIKAMYDLSMRRKKEAKAGEIVYVSIMGEVDVGTEILADGTLRKPEIFTEDIYPSKVFKLSLDAEGLQKAMKVLEGLSGEIHGFKVERIDGGLQISVLGDMQMKYIEDALSEAGISFKIVSERRKGIVTVAGRGEAHVGTAHVEVLPRTVPRIIVTRYDYDVTMDFDWVTASTVADALGIEGMLVIIHRGENPDDLAEAIAKAVEKAGLMEVFPQGNVVVRTPKVSEIIKLTYAHGGQILESRENSLWILLPTFELDSFVDEVYSVTAGKVEVKLIVPPKEAILGIDPGTKHVGLAYIQGSTVEVWHINFPQPLTERKSQQAMMSKFVRELRLFLEGKDKPTKVFIGLGPGLKYAYEAVQRVLGDSINVFGVDETCTTKEALYLISSGKILAKRFKGIVDHAYAAVLIAKHRQVVGKIMRVRHARRKLETYIASHSLIGYMFKRLAGVHTLRDLRPGTYIEVKDPSYIDGKVSKGDVFIYWGLTKNGVLVHTLAGCRMVLRWKAGVHPERDFFKAFSPVKPRT